MEISGTGAANTAASQNSNVPSKELGKDEFMKLLVAQLSNQNPLEPQDGADFVAQLATFSNLEQLTSINTGLDSLALSQAGLIQGQTVDLVGRTVVVEGDRIDVEAGRPTTINYSLSARARSVSVKVYDESGALVREMPGPNETGMSSVAFDGLDSGDDPLPPGTYRIEVEATPEGSEAIDVQTFSTLRVDGVTYESGLPKLMANERRIDPSDVFRVLE